MFSQSFKQKWETYVWGNDLGFSKIIPYDIDNDKADELILGGGVEINNYFSILKYVNGKYVVIWNSKIYFNNIITYLNKVYDSKLNKYQLYVLCKNGQLDIYDLPELKIVKSHSFYCNNATQLFVGDIQNNGTNEIAILDYYGDSEPSTPDSTFLTVYNSEDYSLIWRRCKSGNCPLAVCDFNSDGIKDIAFSNLLINGLTNQVISDNLPYASKYIFEDFNGDGFMDVAGIDGGAVTFFDIITSRVLSVIFHWQIRDFLIADVNGDSLPELIIADAQRDGLVCYDIATAKIIWKSDLGDSNSNLIICDTNGDGISEIVWGSGYDTTGKISLMVASVNDFNETKTILRTENITIHLSPYFRVGAADFDNDGAAEIAYASLTSREEHQGGFLYTINAQNHNEIKSKHITGEQTYALTTFDFNYDSLDEIVFAVPQQIIVLNGMTLEVLSNIYVPDKYPTEVLFEVLDTSNRKSLIFADRGALYIYDLEKNTITWQSSSYGDALANIRIVKHPKSANTSFFFNSVFYNSNNDMIYQVDAATKTQIWQSTLLNAVSSFDIADINNDSTYEIISGHKDGMIKISNFQQNVILNSLQLSQYPIAKLTIVNNNLNQNYIIAVSDKVYCLDFKLNVIWSSQYIVPSNETVPFASLKLADTNKDGYLDIIVGNTIGVFHFLNTSVGSDINFSYGKLPNSFSLSQNYPNPFNPETTISYSIPKSEHVTLKIYDLLGREVATLVNEYKQPGAYNSKFSIVNYKLSSGVYFYRLQSGSYSQTKKLILMK